MPLIKQDATDFMFVSLDDSGVAHLTCCAGRPAVRKAVVEAMFCLQPGDELDADHNSQVDGVVDELFETGIMTFEGDQPLFLYALADYSDMVIQPHEALPTAWWVEELAAFWGEAEHKQTLDTKRAAKVACRLAANVAHSNYDHSAPFQARVQPWMIECFGEAISADRGERNHRFFEEATEGVQANGMTRSEAHQLVDYVYDRPVGELKQEVGGIMVTLAALCLASGVDMHECAEVELARILQPENVVKIRAKQAAKPKHSPLPEHVPSADHLKGHKSLAEMISTHTHNWRTALKVMKDEAGAHNDRDAVAYFEHELKALDDIEAACREERHMCAALMQRSASGNTPSDCDWPVCGCDESANLVIAALQESGQLCGTRAQQDVIRERAAHFAREGFTSARDDAYLLGELVGAGLSYAIHEDEGMPGSMSIYWPRSWDQRWFKATTRRQNLVKACALFIAEIERLDRKAAMACMLGVTE